jgi:hypothetical protein
MIRKQDINVRGGLTPNVRAALEGLAPLPWPWEDHEILMIKENSRPAVFLITYQGLVELSRRFKGNQGATFDRLDKISCFHRFNWDGKFYEAEWAGYCMVPLLDQAGHVRFGQKGKVWMDLFRIKNEVAIGVSYELSEFGRAHPALFKQQQLF